MPTPDLQYMNIYSKNTTRLSCFKSIPIISQEAAGLDECQQDASTYENYLSDYCKKMASKPVYMTQFEGNIV